MPFNVEKIKTKASEKKVDFIIKLSLFSIIMVICILVIIFLFYNTAAVIVGVVSFFWLGYKLGETVKQSNPKMLFSREFSGTVESVRTNTPSRVKKSPLSTASHAAPLIGEITVRTESGERFVIGGMEKDAVFAYKKGDEVYHIRGTVYPIITSRTPAYMPCPICGSLRRVREGKCRRCGVE